MRCRPRQPFTCVEGDTHYPVFAILFIRLLATTRNFHGMLLGHDYVSLTCTSNAKVCSWFEENLQILQVLPSPIDLILCQYNSINGNCFAHCHPPVPR